MLQPDIIIHKHSLPPSIGADLTKIQQLIQDFYTYSSTHGKENIYEFIQQSISIIEIQDITSVMIMAIISEQERKNLKIENTHLQQETVRLLERILSIEKEIDRGVLEVDTNGNILSADDAIVKFS
jgi:hypothetical protein